MSTLGTIVRDGSSFPSRRETVPSPWCSLRRRDGVAMDKNRFLAFDPSFEDLSDIFVADSQDENVDNGVDVAQYPSIWTELTGYRIRVEGIDHLNHGVRNHIAEEGEKNCNS